MTAACRVCGRRDEAAPRPVPFGGDREGWEAAWAGAARRWARAHAGVFRFGAVGRDAVEAALGQLRQVHERTDFGWVRWEMADGQAVPLEVGVLAPSGGLRRWVARSVWGRRPRRVWACWLAGGLPVAAVVVFVLLAVAGVMAAAGVLRGAVAVTVPVTAAVAVAFGLPAALRRLTSSQVRRVRGSALSPAVCRAVVVWQQMHDLPDPHAMAARGRGLMWSTVGRALEEPVPAGPPTTRPARHLACPFCTVRCVGDVPPHGNAFRRLPPGGPRTGLPC